MGERESASAREAVGRPLVLGNSRMDLVGSGTDLTLALTGFLRQIPKEVQRSVNDAEHRNSSGNSWHSIILPIRNSRPRCYLLIEVGHGALKGFGVRVLKTPARAPQANAFCERLIGTIRRECLDFLIPLGEAHLKRILREWVGHYNRGRPHSSLGPGIPEPPQAKVPASVNRHKLPADCRVKSTPVLGWLHHEYRQEKEAA